MCKARFLFLSCLLVTSFLFSADPAEQLVINEVLTEPRGRGDDAGFNDADYGGVNRFFPSDWLEIYNAGSYDSPLAKKALAYCKKRLKLRDAGNWRGGFSFGGHTYYAHYYLAQAMYQSGDKNWKEYFPKDPHFCPEGLMHRMDTVEYFCFSLHPFLSFP
mgnify:CR=1 FL=1